MVKIVKPTEFTTTTSPFLNKSRLTGEFQLLINSHGPFSSNSPRMAQPDQISTSISRDYSGTASSSSSSSSSNYTSFPVPTAEDQRLLHQHEAREPEIEQQQQQYIGISYQENYSGFDDSSVLIDDTWSCAIVVLTFWFFVSMTLILGVYGSMRLVLGPECSVLLQPNPLFVQSIEVEQLYDTNPGLILYGFYKPPPLDVIRTWSKTLNFFVPADSHKESTYFMNEGSQMNISYNVNSPRSSVFLIIAQGNEGLSQWLEDPTYPNTTLSWIVIQGSGCVQQSIFKSASYYIAVGNLNSEDIEGSDSDDWSVKVSYGPRWATYIVGIVGMTVLMLATFNFLNNFRCIREDGTRLQFGGVEPERVPFLSHKDDDLSSWGSFYDSVSNEEELEDVLVASSLEGKSRESENGNNTRRLCAICFDAPRDCFFLPCGHCVACFECGTRMVEADGTCPICHRKMKKVRKIFRV